MPRPDRCKWGTGCSERGGHGRFGNFCPLHADRLGAIDMSAPRRAASKTPEPERATGPDAMGRVPVSVRAAALGRHVQGARGPVSQTEAAEALGLASAKGSLPRVVREARARGYLAPGGPGARRGYRAGSVSAPAPEQLAAA